MVNRGDGIEGVDRYVVRVDASVLKSRDELGKDAIALKHAEFSSERLLS